MCTTVVLLTRAVAVLLPPDISRGGVAEPVDGLYTGGSCCSAMGGAGGNSHSDEYGRVVLCHVSGTVAIGIRSNTGSVAPAENPR